MPRLRILLACPDMANIEHWKTILAQDPDVELLIEAHDAIETLLAAGDARATVVVIDLPQSGQEPGLYSHLLEEYPQVKVIAVAQDGSRAIKYEKGILRREIPESLIGSPKDLFDSLWVESDPVLREPAA